MIKIATTVLDNIERQAAMPDSIVSYLLPTLIGAGVGGTASYLASADKNIDDEDETPKERFTRKLKSALLGAGLGAGIGATGTYAVNQLSSSNPIEDSGALLPSATSAWKDLTLNPLTVGGAGIIGATMGGREELKRFRNAEEFFRNASVPIRSSSQSKAVKDFYTSMAKEHQGAKVTSAWETLGHNVVYKDGIPINFKKNKNTLASILEGAKGDRSLFEAATDKGTYKKLFTGIKANPNSVARHVKSPAIAAALLASAPVVASMAPEAIGFATDMLTGD